MSDELIRTWSPSQADTAERCMLQWSMRYGPLRPDGPRVQSPGDDVARRRGKVLHTALQAALQAATDELATRWSPLTGAHLDRYWRPARVALGQAWLDEQMPSDSGEGQMTTELLRTTLAAVPVPRPGAMHSIEQERTFTLPSGIVVHYVADWTWWEGPGALVVVDWKSGRVEPDEITRHRQLHAYAAWLRRADPTITSVRIELFSMRKGEGYSLVVDPDRAERIAGRIERLAVAAHEAREHAPTTGPHCVGCFARPRCPAVGIRASAA